MKGPITSISRTSEHLKVSLHSTSFYVCEALSKKPGVNHRVMHISVCIAGRIPRRAATWHQPGEPPPSFGAWRGIIKTKEWFEGTNGKRY